jgi:hypothetical protein
MSQRYVQKKWLQEWWAKNEPFLYKATGSHLGQLVSSAAPRGSGIELAGTCATWCGIQLVPPLATT